MVLLNLVLIGGCRDDACSPAECLSHRQRQNCGGYSTGAPLVLKTTCCDSTYISSTSNLYAGWLGFPDRLVHQMDELGNRKGVVKWVCCDSDSDIPTQTYHVHAFCFAGPLSSTWSQQTARWSMTKRSPPHATTSCKLETVCPSIVFTPSSLIWTASFSDQIWDICSRIRASSRWSSLIHIPSPL